MTAACKFASLRIRHAGVRDAERMVELSGQLGYPATREQILRRLRHLQGKPEHAVYVAEAGGSNRKVVGWVHVFLSHALEAGTQAEVGGLVVDAACRRRGIGQRLMQQAEAWVRKKGVREIRLRSNVVRERAHAFYEGLGYQVVKSQKVFRKSL